MPTRARFAVPVYVLILGTVVLTGTAHAQAPGHPHSAKIAAEDAHAPPFDGLRATPAPSAPGSMAPQLTASADGRVFLSWLEPADNGLMRFRVAERRGDAWDLRTDVVEGTDLFANWADVPSIFAAANGRLVAHWLQRTGAGTYAYGIRVRSSADQGKTWSPVAVPHRDQSPTEHGFLSFFDAPNRDIGMIWLDGRATASQASAAADHGHGGVEGAMTLRATTLTAGGTMGPDVLVDGRVCDCCPTAAVRTDRGAIVAYRDRSETEIRDISIARLVNGAWQPGGSVHPDGWEIEGCPVNGPALVSSGEIVALAWFTAAGNQGRAQVAFSRDGGSTFGPPVRVDDGETLGRVDVELLPDGSAVVLWIESVGGRTDLRARRVFSDGRRGPASIVSPIGADRSSGVPRVVRHGNELVFAWRASTPSPHIAVAVASLPVDAAR